MISSAARPNKTITIETDENGQAITFEEGSQPGIVCTESQSADIKVAIQHRAYKNKPLNQRQKQANRLIAKTHYIVEWAFGTGKRLLNIGRASYMITAKVNGQMTLKAIRHEDHYLWFPLNKTDLRRRSIKR